MSVNGAYYASLILETQGPMVLIQKGSGGNIGKGAITPLLIPPLLQPQMTESKGVEKCLPYFVKI